MISDKTLLKIIWAISIALLFPLFFQLSGGIYNSFAPIVDSGGLLAKLPLPISIIACFGGILVFKNNYKRAFLAFSLLIGMLVAMLASLFFAGAVFDIQYGKIILLCQCILPVFGLMLGQMVIDNEKIVPKAFLYVLLLVVPIQLIATFSAGSLTLTHNLYLFSIYQHFQYVPLIFVCAFAYAMVNLWDSHIKIFYVLTPLMFVYAIASISFLTIIAFVGFVAFFAYTKLRTYVNKIIAILIIIMGVMFLAVGMQAYFGIAKNYTSIGRMQSSSTRLTADGSQYVGKIQTLSDGKTPANVLERFEIWKLYESRITESTKTLILGHDAPLPREVRTSAHNWYLDMIYNFGLISVIPTFLLIAYTSHLAWQLKEKLPNETLWLVAIVFYLVVVDNNLKVTLRQPYPGIFAYFLWGLLLSKLIYRRDEAKASFQ